MIDKLDGNILCLLEATCHTCELPCTYEGFDIIRRYGQTLFAELATKLISLDLREELEVGFVRCVHKPIKLRAAELSSQEINTDS